MWLYDEHGLGIVYEVYDKNIHDLMKRAVYDKNIHMTWWKEKFWRIVLVIIKFLQAICVL